MNSIGDELPVAEKLRTSIREMMPGIIADLGDLIRIPSVAFPGFPPGPVLGMARATEDLLKRYGLPDARLITIPGGYPAVFAEVQAPPGAPTVTLYAHYDVQPAGDPLGWKSDPFTPVVRDGRLYGRGSSDNKAGILVNAAAILALSGDLRVGVKLIIEGEEETDSHLDSFVLANPDLFRCDLFVVADMGNLTPGSPAITTSLRGVCACTVRVRTLDHPVHSGAFGGPSPDALIALVRILATLHDAAGDPAVPGLKGSQWRGEEFPEDLFRDTAGMLDGVDLIGTGTIASRLWTGPSVNVIGLDAPGTATAANILIPQAAARISMRIAPGADPAAEMKKLADHLLAVAPWHVKVEIGEIRLFPGFECKTGGTGYKLARMAMETAFGKPVHEIGGGGSIPLVNTLAKAVPGAEFILWGCADLYSNAHGTDESVEIGEIERMILAEALLLASLGS
ncbi:MAG: M20/M25/M40 family metallo-hydrolase [Methanoregulaceae archaeon]|nr:M20/M25/M40 family metallo-hydrolase [Methanoregulaceae archaeon]